MTRIIVDEFLLRLADGEIYSEIQTRRSVDVFHCQGCHSMRIKYSCTYHNTSESILYDQVEFE